MDGYVSVSVAAVLPEIRDHSIRQASRFTYQCFLTCELSKEFIERDMQELIVMNNIVQTTRQFEFPELTKSTLQYRPTLSMPLLTANVVINYSCIQAVSPRTSLLWYNDFERSGFRGFNSQFF